MDVKIGVLALPIVMAACAVTPEPSADFQSAPWQENSPYDLPYRLAPGDVLELTVYSAPELSRTARIGPDGRVRLPLIAPLLAAGYTPEALAERARSAYAHELRQPGLDLLVSEYSSQQIFVGGAVSNPGLFEIPGQIDPLQAVILAGGRTDSANRENVFVMRRLPGGEVKTAVFNLADGLEDPALASWGPLQRFDVIYVPRSRIANHNLFVQQYIRGALPVEFSLFYDIAGNSR
ncbi:MAG: polysaccharide export protein [Hyphomonadaceae bacterium]|nr:polysaccharide export protein [Hyphomonadaceae bacterium]